MKSGSTFAVTLAADIPHAHLANLTREFAQELERSGLKARLAGGPGKSGERGDPISIGAILLIMGGASGEIAIHAAGHLLAERIGSFISREPRMRITVSGPDGTAVATVDAQNIKTVKLLAESLMRAIPS